MKILITGIAGFIGYHVAEKLKDDYDIMIFTGSGDRAQFDLKSFQKIKQVTN